MIYTVPHFINGQFYEEKNTAGFELYNPAVGEIIGRVDFASEKTCDHAIASAKAAWELWSETPPLKRARILFNFREGLEKNLLDLAKIVVREHGKTLEDAKGSVLRAIEVVEHHCSLISQLQGTFSANVAAGIDCTTFRQPIGVCAGVSPFNFPVMVPVWMMIPAIAAGNTFILKPSEQAPSPPLRLLELLHDAGLPQGVVNCIHGNKTTVDYLIHHRDIVALTAVASTPVAKAIYTEATSLGKRAHTFGGAKNHALLMPDADLNHAANAILSAAFGSAGERCMALSVVVAVGSNTADNLVQHLTSLISKIKIDSGDVPDTDMGPLISHAHRMRVLKAIDEGVQEGAELIVDGRTFQHPAHPQGFFVGPTLFDKVTEEMSIYQNEIFGPVLIVVRVNSFEEAIALVNRNQYGNGTAIFTRDGHTARTYSQQVQVGMVGVNIPIPVPVANHPFGGWKQSSFGDTPMHGLESIHFYTKLKTITSKWPAHDNNNHAFAMPTNQ